MAPPPAAAPAVHPVIREVTEDTPPDLLEGTMDLMVILPSGKTVHSTVDRKTPMMDLLIHIATANKINPAGHIVQVRNERGIEMPYKPSTPIGALDTTTIEIVPKNRVNEYIIVKKPAKVANQPFETTFRLQVHLPRNQLHVMRVSSKILLDDILQEVCREKNLDISKYEIRHPVNLDHKFPLSLTVGETGLQELTVVSKNSKINSSVSSADIIALQQSEEGRAKGCLDGSFKHSRSSVGDSSVSSESTGSGRGISPCRSEDSRSISPLPLIRPKTLIHGRTASNLSTCSSSGNSSTGQFKTNTLNSSILSSQVSHQQVVMQAPPRTKKRAAPQPPSNPTGAKVNNINNTMSGSTTSLNVSSPNNATCSTPTNGLGSKAGTPGVGGPLEKPTPRKKEAPREPPKVHHPLTHHQSLPLNHSRHNSGSNVTDIQQDIGSLVRPDSQQLERVQHPAIMKMSSRQSISSSMTNLTSVSSVSSTSLASSTGGLSKKRRAPKPPVLAALNPPTQIEEETTTTDSEASTLRGADSLVGASGANTSYNNSLQQRQNHPVQTPPNENSVGEDHKLPVVGNGNVVVPDDPKEIEVLSTSTVSSLSSPTNSASESTSSSPIPPASSSSSQVTMKEQQQNRSMNANEKDMLRSGRSGSRAADTTGSQFEEQDYESESRSSNRSYSRSSSSPSSSSNIAGAPSPPHADSTSIVVERSSRNVLSSSNDATVDQDAQSSSCRPPSSNTQVSPPRSSSSTTSSTQAMPMPLPRRRAPAAPKENSPSSLSAANYHANAPVPSQVSVERSSQTLQKLLESKVPLETTAAQQPQQQQNNPRPKPRPRSDRISMEPEPPTSQADHITKPQSNRASTPSQFSKLNSNGQSEINTSIYRKHETNTNSVTAAEPQKQQQPGLSGALKNPLSKYGVKVLPDNVLQERAERLKRANSSTDPEVTSSPASQASDTASPSYDVDNDNAQKPSQSHKLPTQRASKSSTSTIGDDFSDTGSITSLTKNHKISTGSIGKSGGVSKPMPFLAKSDYTSQGSVRSIKQLTSTVARVSSVESSNCTDDDSNKEGGYESDNLEENLDFFEPVGRRSARNFGEKTTLTKSVSSSQSTPASTTSGDSLSKQTATFGRQNEQDKMVKTSAAFGKSGNKPRVFSSVSGYDYDGDESSNLVHSPSVVSESGFVRNTSHSEHVMMKKKSSDEEDSSSKLNRWQNMVSLNEIGSSNHKATDVASNRINNPASSVSDPATYSTSTNPPKVPTRSVLGSSASNKQKAAPLLPDERQHESTTCHSSESEASYTDSGIPATETVTPSPVNLDDVILDHEYHAGSHSEKFSSEDGEELKNSSRRSSIQSDHSEEWMNILEAKMNKDEEAIEKMFEAVLPPGEEINSYTPSPTPPTEETVVKKNDDGRRDPVDDIHRNVEHERIESEPVSQGKTQKRRDIHTDSEDDNYEARNNKGMESDDCKEMIETTVELHHVPVEHQDESEEDKRIETMDSSETSFLADNITAATAVPGRKISKSESFSHNSEFNEVTQRRKNFKTSRGNAMLTRGSQSSGSATDLRRSSSLSDSEDELEDLGPDTKFEVKSKSSYTHPNDRTVSMSDLSPNKLVNGTNETKLDDRRNEVQRPSVHKATSLQKLPGEVSNDTGKVDAYKKQLEMQFEQWKQEFMKQHSEKSEDLEEDINGEVEQMRDPQVVETHLETTKEIDNSVEFAGESNSAESLTVPTIDDTKASARDISSDGYKPAPRVEERQERVKGWENSLENKPVKESSKPVVAEPEEKREEMNNSEYDKFSHVELRKKEAPKVVYQYSGPPTIKMASWGDRPHRAVSVKEDKDYIMGMGQQDPNTKSVSPGRIHSFHGGPVVNMTQSQQQTEVSSVISNKSKHDSSPTPTTHIQVNKGWSAVINAPNVLPNSTGAVKSVLSAWKQRMEETEKEKNKPREGPPAEIDIYGSENAISETPTKVTHTVSQMTIQTGVNKLEGRDKVVVENSTSTSKLAIEKVTPKPVVIDTKPTVKAIPPKVPEKSKTLGSSFRTAEKPVVFTISPMESNTLPKQKAPVAVHIISKSDTDTVDTGKPSPATSTIEISSLEDKKKFFQGIKPVENNSKESPIPATNMKSNIAAIQKVFEKQRMSKMKQMGSQQSLYSDGTVSPVPSLQRNDSLESRQSNLRRQNSIESHSSDSSSVVLRVSQNSSGKASPQLSANEMVQKLFGKTSGMNNYDPLRRTPSPISSTTSTLSSSTSYERFTPSPTVVDGPNNTVRISTGGYKAPSTNNIRSVGNKAIIIVNSDDSSKNASVAKDSKPIRTSVNENIVLSDSNSIKKSSVSNAYMSTVLQQQNQLNYRNSAPPAPPQIKQNVTTTNVVLKKVPSVADPIIISHKNVRNAQTNGSTAPPPPPPPPADGMAKTSGKPQSLDVKKVVSTGRGNARNSNPNTPTSPMSSDPRSEIFNAIKNSNGNFGLKKTGSSILLK